MIDWARIEELRDEVGAEDFGEVVELFIEEVEEVIGYLSQAPDHKKLEERMHFLKGSALNLGFATFSRQCQIGEKAASEGRASEVDIAAILETYAHSKSEFVKGVSALANYVSALAN